MKSFVKLFAIAIATGALIVTNTASATPQGDPIKVNQAQNQDKSPSAFNVLLKPSVKNEKIKMFLIKPAGQRLSVRLIAPDGTPLLSFLTDKKAENVYRNLNFTDAEEGVYKLSVTNGKETVVREIVYKRRHTIVEPSLVVK